MKTVRGPFIEYDCTECGTIVQAKISMNKDRLTDDIAELTNNPKKRVCASCWRPE